MPRPAPPTAQSSPAYAAWLDLLPSLLFWLCIALSNVCLSIALGQSSRAARSHRTSCGRLLTCFDNLPFSVVALAAAAARASSRVVDVAVEIGQSSWSCHVPTYGLALLASFVVLRGADRSLRDRPASQDSSQRHHSAWIVLGFGCSLFWPPGYERIIGLSSWRFLCYSRGVTAPGQEGWAWPTSISRDDCAFLLWKLVLRPLVFDHSLVRCGGRSASGRAAEVRAAFAPSRFARFAATWVIRSPSGIGLLPVNHQPTLFSFPRARRRPVAVVRGHCCACLGGQIHRHRLRDGERLHSGVASADRAKLRARSAR